MKTPVVVPGAKTAESSEGVRKGVYESQVDRLSLVAQADVEAALQRFGFAFFHSLPGETQVLLKEQLGIEAEEAEDLYNLGCAYASKSDLDKAILLWGKALKQDPELAEAKFNIALANEKLGKTAVAIGLFEEYLQSLTDPEEIDRVKAHLAELRA